MKAFLIIRHILPKVRGVEDKTKILIIPARGVQMIFSASGGIKMWREPSSEAAGTAQLYKNSGDSVQEIDIDGPDADEIALLFSAHERAKKIINALDARNPVITLPQGTETASP